MPDKLKARRGTTNRRQESVWDYPRPPRLERTDRLVVVEFAGQRIGVSRRAFRVLETSHPPSYYLPAEDVTGDLLQRTYKRSYCEWKGRAVYYDVAVGETVAANAAWSYPAPIEAYQELAGAFSFYPDRVDCYVDGELVGAQAGGFYGGWITEEIVGPFKGEPGTESW